MGNTTNPKYLPIQNQNQFKVLDLYKIIKVTNVTDIPSPKNVKIQKVIYIDSPDMVGLKPQLQKLVDLNHANIIKTIEFYQETHGVGFSQTRTLSIIQENFIGQTFLHELKKFQVDDIMHIYDQLKSALLYLHQRLIEHKFIKLDKIMVNKNKVIKLRDFGLFQELKQSKLPKLYKSLPEIKYYEPPEMEHNCKSDLWSLGIILIQLAMGKLIRYLFDGIPSINLQRFKQCVDQLQIHPKIMTILNPLLQINPQNRRFYVPSDQLILASMKIDNDYLETKLLNFIDLYTLISLDISNCLVTDSAGKIIPKYSNKLKKLNISGNRLTDRFFKYLNNPAALNQLNQFNLAFNDIGDQSLLIITQNMPEIRDLDLSFTKVTDLGLKSLYKLTNLKTLKIWSDWSESIPPRYINYVLRNRGRNYLQWKNNRILLNRQSIKVIQNINLEEITLNTDNVNINDMLIGQINDLHCVQIVGKLNEEGINRITNSINLQTVYLKEVNLKQKKFASKDIREMSLINCDLAIKEFIMSLNTYEKLSILNLDNCKITDNTITQICSLRYLKELFLPNNKISQSGAQEISENICFLTLLNLDNNNICDPGAISISTKIVNLKILSLSRNNIGDSGIKFIGPKLVQLETLYLCYNRIEYQGAQQLIVSLKNIKTLNLLNNNIDNTKKPTLVEFMKQKEFAV